MQKTEFIRQLNELVPSPDPVTTEALYRFDRECAETEYIDMLTALRVVARNFSEETLQGAYEIIQHQNAALPSELFAAAVYFQAGRTPAEVSGLAKEGRLMGFFGPERPEEPSRIATCTIVESGQEHRFYTMDFGRFNPQHALKRAITYGRETGISATQAMARLTMDQPEFAEKLALAAAPVAEERKPDLRLVEIARTRRPVDHQVGALEKVVAPDVIGLFGKIDAVDGRHNPGADRIHIGGAGLRAGPGSGRDRQVPHLVTFHLALRHDIQPFNVLRHVERGRNRRKTRQCRLFHKRLPIVGIPEIDRIILAGNLGSDIHRHGRPVVESPGILFIKFGIVDILVDTRRGRQCREHECQSGNVHGSNV